MRNSRITLSLPPEYGQCDVLSQAPAATATTTLMTDRALKLQAEINPSLRGIRLGISSRQQDKELKVHVTVITLQRLGACERTQHLKLSLIE